MTGMSGRQHLHDRERAVSVDALAAVLAGASSSERAVRMALRQLPHLDQQGRRRVARRIIATGVLRARLAWTAGVALDDAAGLVRALIAEEERAARGEPAPHARPWPADPLERMAVERSAPPFLVEELGRSLGLAGADAFLAASNHPGPVTLRANLARTDSAALQSLLGDQGIHTESHPHVPGALHVRGHANLFGSAAWREGLFEVQDASSQRAALLCGAQPGDVVVDLCAGRGGKTLALAAQLRGEGRIHVHDIDARALADMRPRLARAGVHNVVEGLPPPRSADVVLVDAPCSALGPLRRSPDLRWTLDPRALLGLPDTQRRLLLQGARLVRPNGRLVYATCTVRDEENGIVVRAAAEHVALEVEEEHRFLPHVDGGDGFYVAVLRVG